jgi:DUF3037 family protein
MPSRYCIVRYVPNPLTEERINVGIIAYDDAQVRVRFLERWNRVRHFAGRDITFLRELARDLEAAVGEQRLLAVGSDPITLHGSAIERMAAKWINLVQLSEPRASLAPVDQVLNEMTALFLAEGQEHPREFRDHRYARRYLQQGVRRALEQRLDPTQVTALLGGTTVRGSHQEHSFDIVIANGATYGAGSGLSFEAPEVTKGLQMTADALAWSIDDVHQREPRLPLAVAVLPPARATPDSRRLYSQSVRIYRELGAEVLSPAQITAWARKIAAKLPR